MPRKKKSIVDQLSNNLKKNTKNETKKKNEESTIDNINISNNTDKNITDLLKTKEVDNFKDDKKNTPLSVNIKLVENIDKTDKTNIETNITIENSSIKKNDMDDSSFISRKLVYSVPKELTKTKQDSLETKEQETNQPVTEQGTLQTKEPEIMESKKPETLETETDNFKELQTNELGPETNKPETSETEPKTNVIGNETTELINETTETVSETNETVSETTELGTENTKIVSEIIKTDSETNETDPETKELETIKTEPETKESDTIELGTVTEPETNETEPETNEPETMKTELETNEPETMETEPETRETETIEINEQETTETETEIESKREILETKITQTLEINEKEQINTPEESRENKGFNNSNSIKSKVNKAVKFSNDTKESKSTDKKKYLLMGLSPKNIIVRIMNTFGNRINNFMPLEHNRDDIRIFLEKNFSSNYPLPDDPVILQRISIYIQLFQYGGLFMNPANVRVSNKNFERMFNIPKANVYFILDKIKTKKECLNSVREHPIRKGVREREVQVNSYFIYSQVTGHPIFMDILHLIGQRYNETVPKNEFIQSISKYGRNFLIGSDIINEVIFQNARKYKDVVILKPESYRNYLSYQ